MAERRTLARPYAKAIFEIALEMKDYDKWSTLLTTLALVAENKEMQPLLRDRTIPSDVLGHFFLAVTEKVIDALARNFILVLAAHKRLEVLPEVHNLFEEMRATAENRIAIHLAAPVALDVTEQKRFKKIFEKEFSRTVHMHCTVDQKLLGGFIARAGNYVIDGSLRGQLINLKKAMGEAS